jgi:NmrA-like family.
VEVVAADIDDAASLRKAFDGAHVVFANTVTIYDGHAYEHEVIHGHALADAAVDVDVPYYIYSTLPNAGKISNGKLKNMGHFDGKEEVEQYIRTLPMESAFIAPGSFMSNLHASMAPHPVGDGTYVFATSVSPKAQTPLINTAGDTGKWVATILADFPKYKGQVLCCATSLYTFEKMAEVTSKASGKTVVYRQLPKDVWRSFLPPLMRDHIAEMLQCFQDYGYYGENTAEKVK